MRVVQIRWTVPDEPWKGFEYLFLSDADHRAFCARHGGDADGGDGGGGGRLPYVATRVNDASPPHWRLHDVVGSEAGIGVECLSGSGAIAAAFARAFEATFTLTIVSGRTVGIGAYLARLGRRCAVQRRLRQRQRPISARVMHDRTSFRCWSPQSMLLPRQRQHVRTRFAHVQTPSTMRAAGAGSCSARTSRSF